MITPFTFWTRIDSLLGKRSLVWLSEKTGLNYGTMKKRRALDRFPTIEDCCIIAASLGTTVDFLMAEDEVQLIDIMEENMVTLDFWKRVDELLGKRTLVWLAEAANIYYPTVKNERTLNRYPNIHAAYSIAKALDTTVEYLLTGIKTETEPAYENPNEQALIRALRREPGLIDIIGPILIATEKHIK